MEKERFLRLLGIKDKLPEAEELTRGIKRLILTGLFDDIKISQEEGHLEIYVKEREIIERIKVRGNLYIPDNDIINAFLLKEGEAMRYELLGEAVSGLKDYLAKRGFPEAEIKVSVKRKGQRIGLILQVKEGEPVIVKKIEGPEEVTPFIRLSVGGPFDLFLLERDKDYIRQYLKSEGFIRPEVTAEFKEGILRFRIERGLKVVIDFSGNRHISKKELLKIMPFYEAEEVSKDLIEEAMSRILLAYKKEGYPFTVVNVDERRGCPDEVTTEDCIYLRFNIDEGDRYSIEKVHFAGNTIPRERLLEIMGIERGDYYIEGKIKAGIERLKAIYKSLGYRDIEIDDPVIDFDKEAKGVNILIKIKEGRKILIDRLIIRGFRAVDETILRNIAGIKEGDPFNETDINDARLRIIEFYSERGYSGADCDVDLEFLDDRAIIIFNITEGERSLFGKTIIRGNLRTSSRVIERELPYKEGDNFRQGALLETGQRLYRLGLFSDVQVEPVKADGKEDILITVREAPAGAAEFGVGYGEYERYRGFLGISYRNLWGMNRQLSFRTELSSLEERYLFNYYDPRVFDTRISLRIIPLYEERQQKNIDTGEILYRLRRYSNKIGLEIPFSRHLRVDLYHEFSLVKTYDLKPEVILPREDTGTLAISSLIPGVIYDTRDNPFDPRSGLLLGGRVKFAPNGLGSQVEFLKVAADMSTYLSLSRRFVLALGVKGGAVWPFGKTEEIPIVERFFLGGRSSVRGFSQDSLGPKIDDTPVGGNYFIQTNMELRWYPGRSLSFVTFIDGGNVWLRDEAISMGDLRYSAGIGIRYNTPAGPVRLDYGRKLERMPGESAGEFHFSIGHAF